MKLFPSVAVLSLSLALFGCVGGTDNSASSTSSGAVSSMAASSSEASSEGTSSSSASPGQQALLDRGMAVYAEPYESSVYSCNLCHALEEGNEGFGFDGFKRPGHPLGDALRRPHFKNARVTEFVDAANSCLDEWMNATDASGNLVQWNNNSPDLLALKALLESQDTGTGEAPALEFVIGAPDVPAEQGDAVRGNEVFNKTCAICHGEDGIIPDGSQLAFDIRHRGIADEAIISQRVRTSGRRTSPVYDGLTGGAMPFWAEDRMSDQELADIIAFLDSVDRNTQPTDGGNNGGDNGGGNGCGMTSAKIGQKAELINRSSHGVSGTATIIDDCTIEITNFNFDGTGVRVEFYGAQDIGDFVSNKQQTFSIDRTDFLRRPGYVNETVTVRLQPGVSLDDFNSISVWCVPIGIDFGSGTFQ